MDQRNKNKRNKNKRNKNNPNKNKRKRPSTGTNAVKSLPGVK